MTTSLFMDTYSSPCGDLCFITTQTNALVYVDFSDNGSRRTRLLQRHFPKGYQLIAQPLPDIRRAFDAFFQGSKDAFEALPLHPCGTDFQQQVWQHLRTLAIGETKSYRQLAEDIGRPKAVRAVANANAQNPVSILTPCHRIIGQNGQLTGYAGGLARKKWLLDFERQLISDH